SIYRAVQHPDHRPVVLKVVDPRRASPQQIERLKREHEIGQTLRGRAVVQVLALDVYRGMPALVMEDFGGQPLAQLLDGPMDTEEFLKLAIRIAGAVADIHRHNIVHKDIKPDNIFVEPSSGEIKIGGFGL